MERRLNAFDLFATPSERSINGRASIQSSLESAMENIVHLDTLQEGMPKYPTLLELYQNTQTSMQENAAFKNQVIMAIAEGVGVAKGEIGLAYMDLSYPVLHLSQLADTTTYCKLQTKIDILNPVEILLPKTAATPEGRMHPLYTTIRHQLKHVEVTFVNRRSFSEVNGMEMLRRLCLAENKSILSDLREKYYCVACASALLGYIEEIQRCRLANESIQLAYEGSENSMIIDSNARRDLELITNLKSPNDAEASLFGILNHTFTNGGSRTLRASLLQPSYDLSTIEQRHQAIEELIANPQILTNLRSALGSMRDMERSMAVLVHKPIDKNHLCIEGRIKEIILLMNNLELVEPLAEITATLNSGKFVEYSSAFGHESRNQILRILNNYVRDESLNVRGPLKWRNQICFAIQPNLNGLLDILRRSYTEYVNDVETYHMNFVRKTGVAFNLAHSMTKGFYFTLNLQDNQEPPQDVGALLTNVSRKHSRLQCSTVALIQLNERIDLNYKEILVQSNELLNNLIDELHPHMAYLYHLSEVICWLDFILSLATHALNFGWVRPQFTDDTMAILQARHPLLERQSNLQYTANDVYAGPDSNFIIITGPNMSGKSTHLKMIGTLQALAQAGSFVPAGAASFRLCDRLFTRIEHNDNLEFNSSSFMVEMVDMRRILNNFTDSSTILIDELGRNTSDEEGYACCVAISERLLNSKAFVFLATHYLDLVQLDRLYPYVDSYYFNLETDSSISHRLMRGAYSITGSGLELAHLSLLPNGVIETAKEYLNQIRQNKQRTLPDAQVALLKRQRAVMRLYNRLVQVANMTDVDNGTLHAYLAQLREGYEQETCDIVD